MDTVLDQKDWRFDLFDCFIYEGLWIVMKVFVYKTEAQPTVTEGSS